MKVKLPAEEQDRLMRPAYITYNQSGVALCENRYAKSLSISMFQYPWLAVLSPQSKDGMRTLALGRFFSQRG